MFEVKINDNNYYVFGENEVSFVTRQNHVIIPTPNFYDLEIIPEKTTIIKFTNNEPVIIPSKMINYNNIFETYEGSFGTNLSLEEYETLYELYLNQMQENPTTEYTQLQEIKQDIKHAKTLVKKNKRA